MIELTVITVVKNNLPGLLKTRSSLDKQTNQNFFWLIMDGQSTDGTLNWLKSVDRPLFKFVSAKDRSLFEAMNKAIAIMETEYCLFLNSGDFFWDGSVVEGIIGSIRHLHFDFGYGQYVIGGVGGFPPRVRRKRIRRTTQLFYGDVPCHQASVISKRAFQENGGYADNLGIWGDREWILRYAKKRPPSTFTYLPFVIAYYDPKGFSYLKFFRFTKTYLEMQWRAGSFLEFTWAIVGWCKTAAYILLSKLLKTRKNDFGIV